MKNLLKVSALACVFAIALTSCESKPAAETTTTDMSTETTAPAMGTDSASMMATDSTMMTAPADGTSTTTTTQE